MSLDNRPESSREITGIRDLLAGFHAAEKQPSAFRVGMEHEKIGVLCDTLEAVPYYGPRSIEAVFKILTDHLGFEPYLEGDDVVALIKSGTNVSLEPGGQLELSGAVLKDIHASCKELTEHRDLTRVIGERLGITWLGVGHRPFATRKDIEWVPKKRYEIMRRYLPTRGSRALDMMLQTGTVQTNFDWSDEADMARKMRTAMGVTSIVSAIYANSSIVEGEVTGWVSERQRIWLDTDPDRSGLLPFVFDEGFGYRDYVEWALDVPMFFIRRGGRYIGEIAGTPFRTFLEKGFQGERARMSDWDDHLTTLFPEVRIKGFLEVRGADCCSRELVCAHPALWKGLLYDDTACEDAWRLVKGWSMETRQRLLGDVAKDGLAAQVDGVPLLDYAKDLLRISEEGLRRQHRLDEKGRDETRFLEPVRVVLEEHGVSPGRRVAELWEGELRRDPGRLAEHYRF